MSRFLNWSGIVQTSVVSAPQDAVSKTPALPTLLDKSVNVMQQTTKNLQGVDWGQALRQFFAGAAGIVFAIVCGIIYYAAFFPIVSEQLGCRCDWDPLLQAILIVVGILPLALWPTFKFRRL